jgi:hypothetical protein
MENNTLKTKKYWSVSVFMYMIGIVFSTILLSLSLISAQDEIYQVNQEVDLKFTCTLNNAIPSAAADFNITINYPNGSGFINNQETTALGNGAFNYTITFPITGLYKVQMFCWDGTYSYSNEGFYSITPTGKSSLSILNHPILIILGLIGLVLVSIASIKGIPWFGFIGSIMFLLLGIYTMIYGFDDVTNLYTRGVAITFLGVGIIFMFLSAYEWAFDEESGGED